MRGLSARPTFWQNRIVAPVRAQLTQGVTAEKIALTIALGAAFGIFPVVGTSTVLCAAVGVWLRLNQPIIQLVNYLAYPAQFALLIPFCRAGEWLFGAPPVPIFSATALAERFAAGPGQFLLDYGKVGLYGIVVWSLAAGPLVALIYFGLRPALRQAGRLRSSAA